MADERTHATARDEKFDERWKSMLTNQGVRIGLLKTTTAAKKRNTDLAFLMVADPAEMDGPVATWYKSQCDLILNELTPEEPATPTPSRRLLLHRLHRHQALRTLLCRLQRVRRRLAQPHVHPPELWPYDAATGGGGGCHRHRG